MFDWRISKPQNDESMLAVAASTPIKTFQNHVYFYRPVTDASIAELMIELRRVDDEWNRGQAFYNVKNKLPICLHIHSYGGELLAAFAFAGQVKSLTLPVHSYIEGAACSAATIISTACEKRYITSDSLMLIHQLSNGGWGTHEQLKDMMQMQEIAMARIVNHYERRTKLSRDAIQQMLTRDYWMDAQEAREKGFVDGVID